MNRTHVQLCVISFLLAACSISLAEWNLEWRTIDGGGAMRSTSGSFELSGTIGQSDAGRSDGPTLSLTGGFWFEHTLGDCVLDGSVTLLDAASYADCAAGPDSLDVSSPCACMDFDGDGDVDLGDAAELQIVFSAP